MPRVHEIDLSALPEPLRERLAAQQQALGGEATWQKVMAHRPKQLGHLLDLMACFSDEERIPRRLRELIVVTVSKANACDHCVGRHSVRLNKTGLPHATIDALLEPDCPGLSVQETLVRDYALAVTRDSRRLRDATFDRLRAHFDDTQIVEITLLITLAGFFNAFNNAMQVELDAGHAAMLAEQRTDEQT